MKGLAVVGGVALFLLMMTLGAVFNGLVIKAAWAWFAVPIFGLPMLSLGKSVAVAFLVGYMTSSVDPNAAKEQKSSLEKIATSIAWLFVKPAIGYLFAWILHLMVTV